MCAKLHLQVDVVVKAVWGIFDNTNFLYLQVNTLLVIYKSRYYSIYEWSPTCDFQMSHLTEHRIGADLAHVPSLISGSDVTNRQLPMFSICRRCDGESMVP